MVRQGILFVALCGLSVFFVWHMADVFGVDLQCWSFGVGIVTAGFTGFLAFIVNNWFDTAGRPNHPQIVEMPTRETPNQVVEAGCWAMVRLIAFAVLIAMILAGVVLSR